MINITSQVQGCLRESGIQEGLLLVNAMHIIAAVFVNDDEPGSHQDHADEARSSPDAGRQVQYPRPVASRRR